MLTVFLTNSLNIGKAVFDPVSYLPNGEGLSKPTSVWMDDATYKDVAGKATMTEKETEAVTKSLSGAGKTFQKINSGMLTKFLNIQNNFTGNLAGASLKTYNNSKYS